MYFVVPATSSTVGRQQVLQYLYYEVILRYSVQYLDRWGQVVERWRSKTTIQHTQQRDFLLLEVLTEDRRQG